MQSEDSLHTGDGSVNMKGELAVKRETGTWKACPFILGDHLFYVLFSWDVSNPSIQNCIFCLTSLYLIIQVLSFVNVWHIMGLPQILSHISPPNYTKELFRPQETLPLFRGLAILPLSSDPSLWMLTGEDTGQLQCSTESISL